MYLLSSTGSVTDQSEEEPNEQGDQHEKKVLKSGKSVIFQSSLLQILDTFINNM